MKYIVVYISHSVATDPALEKEVFNTEADAREFILALTQPSYLIHAHDDYVAVYHD